MAIFGEENKFLFTTKNAIVLSSALATGKLVEFGSMQTNWFLFTNMQNCRGKRFTSNEEVIAYFAQFDHSKLAEKKLNICAMCMVIMDYYKEGDYVEK